ncbi:Pycsar system effector family protein [Chitinophaga lutea]
MDISSVIAAAQAHVTRQFELHASPVLVYHNIAHTQQVVQAAEQIAAYYRLSQQDLLCVVTAAWFHDVGYLLGERQHHEAAGAEAAKAFMLSQGLPEGTADAVAGCILATRLPQQPNNLMEQIVCDADLFHLGSKEFSKRNKLMRTEAELAYGSHIQGIDWTKSTIQLLENHHYHTAYCQTLLKQQKEENLEKLRSKLEARQSEALLELEKQEAKAAKEKKDELKAERKKEEKAKEAGEKRPDRGIETMFRTTSTNHIRLSSMADSKANIMISVNAIIISVLLSVLLRKLEDYPNFILPSIIFLTTSVTTIVFSVLATRPNVTSGRFTETDIRNKSANLLFFGNFHDMSYDEYEKGMNVIMEKGEYLYSNMIHDIYNLGVVLGRKYHLLRLAYNTFMFGIVASVLAFVIAAVFFPVKG